MNASTVKALVLDGSALFSRHEWHEDCYFRWPPYRFVLTPLRDSPGDTFMCVPTKFCLDKSIGQKIRAIDLSVCLSVCFLCLPVRPFIFVCLSVCLSVCLPVCFLSVYQSVHPSVSVCLSVYLSVCLTVWPLCMCLCVCMTYNVLTA